MSFELNPPLSRSEEEIVQELRSRTNIANAIASHRIRLGLTQDELGRRARTKQSRISELENLQGNVRFDTLDRIARAMGLMIALVPRDQTDTVTIEAPASARL